jgi:hypothetical protein
MPFAVTCPSCSATVSVPDEMVTCPRCKRSSRRLGLVVAACALVVVAGAAALAYAWRDGGGTGEERRAGDDRREPAANGKGDADERPDAKKDDKKPVRRRPAILNVEEARIALARVQVRSYYLSYDEQGLPTHVYVLEDKVVEGAGKVPRPVRIDRVKDEDVLARQVRPVRMAILAAAFPYKAQVREFRDKVGLRSDDEVLGEAAQGRDGKPRPAFRFLGVIVERRELGADGEPAAGDAGQWTPLDLAKDYRFYVFATGKEFEPDDEALAPVTFRGLVMKRLRQFGSNADAGGDKNPRPAARKHRKAEKERERDRSSHPPDQYPAIEKELPKLAETLEKVNAPPPSSRFPGRDEVIDPFSNDGNAPKPQKAKELPEYCLVRVVDVTVRPGRTYEYRLKVRMRNPNHLREDAADADVEALESAEWSSPKLMLHVDPELRYYAVDQAEAIKLAAKPETYRDRYSVDFSRGNLNPLQMTFFQAHRWVERIRLPTVSRFRMMLSQGPDWVEVPFGDWVIAERFPVWRGEYVGRSERVDVPRWDPRLDDFVLATDPKAKKAKDKEPPGVLVSFGHDRNDGREALLVDFDNGPVRHQRTLSGGEGKPTVKLIEDAGAGEALLLSPDGKLILHERATDAADEDRVGRLAALKKRIKALKARPRPPEEKKGLFDD